MAKLVAALLLCLVLAGCSSPPAKQEAPGATSQGNLWEQGLASFYETPSHVQVRDAAARTAAAAAPGEPAFAPFDLAMTSFMETQGVPAGQLALMHDGRLVYASGYGITKEDGSAQTTADTMFRLASVTKPMTHALLALQVEQGLYAWDDPVFCLPPSPAADCRIPLLPHPDHPVVDPRLAEITVQHLVDHTAGWGRSTDYLYRAEGTEKVREALGITGVPDRWHGAQYLMGIELADDPGTYWYCNVCYMLATLVAEAATGASIAALFEAYLFRPLGISGDIELGKPFPAERNPREPFYDADHERPSAYEPETMVHAPDGGFNIGMLAGTGGLVATAEAVAAVYEAYWERVPEWSGLRVSSVSPYSETQEMRRHGGLLDGTMAASTWVRDTGGPGGVVQYVVLFNDGSPSGSCSEFEVVTDDLTGCAGLALETQLLNLALAKARERSLA